MAARITYAQVPNTRDAADLVEFAARALVLMRRNFAAEAGRFHDANEPVVTATAGAVIASPSYPAADPGLTDQNYVFHWIRDAAVTTMELAAAPTPDANGVDRALCDYVDFSRVCQDNAIAVDRFFLARFTVDGAPLTMWDETARAYVRYWSEQKDGPALQSLSFVAAWPYLDAAAKATARQVAQLNLDHTVSRWNDDVDKLGPWEDVSGPSFFARAAQVRFLQEVQSSNALGLVPPAGLDAAADGFRAELDRHWSDVDGWYRSIPGGRPDVEGYDPNADVLMACVYGSVPSTDRKLLATAAKLRGAFTGGGSDPYAINDDDRTLRDIGPMVGRYPGDTYDGDFTDPPNEGHPWAICTANFAQLYYLLAEEFQAGNGPEFDDLTRTFFSQVGLDETAVNDGRRADLVAATLIDAGDKMLRSIVFHADDTHLSEQFDRVSGFEKSVADLTWSYAAFTAAVRARP